MAPPAARTDVFARPRPRGLTKYGPGGAGLKTAATQAPELAQVKGVALQNGIPRQDAAVDFMARSGGLLEASQCDEYDGIPQSPEFQPGRNTKIG